MVQQIGLFSNEPVKESVARPRAKRAKSESTTEIGELTSKVSQLVKVIELQQQRVNSLETLVVDLRDTIAAKKTIKESYTTIEVAKILGKKPYTVREWCRLQRINAFKAMCGRGCEEEWRVSHEELERIQNDGLLPVPERY